MSRDRCGAQKKDGTLCQQFPLKGRSRCRLHGGATPQGLASPNLRHGRYSKALPARMAAAYQSALEDPELLSTREDIAALLARQEDLLARADTGEAGALWRGVRAAWADLHRSEAAGKPVDVAAAIATLDRLIKEGVADYQAWDEVLKTVEQVRRLRETERKRLEVLEATVTAEQLTLFVGALTDSLRRHVTDRKVLDAIGRDVEQLLARPGGA